ncbi:MAG: glyoxalase [Acidimicrobiia bacterium]|nr:glyoxalase [Acidimicrobiia bacterium]
MQIDHVQLSGPPGCEPAMRVFWTLLGFVEIPKPDALVSRGGCWFRNGNAEVHIGIETPFTPAIKAHPGLAVADLDDLSRLLIDADGDPVWDDLWPGRRRFYVTDPVGNRLEFLDERA